MRAFEEILKLHRERYPLMEPQDYGKLAFQSEFGPEHLVSDPERVLARLKQERSELQEGCPAIMPEDIGNGLCRFHLSACAEEQLPRLAERFCRSAREHRGTRAGLDERLTCVRELRISGMEEWLAEYEAAGCPAVHHSRSFRDAYGPHYRVIKWEYARQLLER